MGYVTEMGKLEDMAYSTKRMRSHEYVISIVL